MGPPQQPRPPPAQPVGLGLQHGAALGRGGAVRAAPGGHPSPPAGLPGPGRALGAADAEGSGTHRRRGDPAQGACGGRRAAGRLSATPLMAVGVQITRIYCYVPVVSLQYLGPIILTLHCALLLKTLGESPPGAAAGLGAADAGSNPPSPPAVGPSAPQGTTRGGCTRSPLPSPRRWLRLHRVPAVRTGRRCARRWSRSRACWAGSSPRSSSVDSSPSSPGGWLRARSSPASSASTSTSTWPRPDWGGWEPCSCPVLVGCLPSSPHSCLGWLPCFRVPVGHGDAPAAGSRQDGFYTSGCSSASPLPFCHPSPPCLSPSRQPHAVTLQPHAVTLQPHGGVCCCAAGSKPLPKALLPAGIPAGTVAVQWVWGSSLASWNRLWGLLCVVCLP